MQKMFRLAGALGTGLASFALAGTALAADTSNPVVYGVTPVSVAVNVATTFSASYADAVGVTGCDLYVDGVNKGAMNLSGSTSGTATMSYVVTSSGVREFYARCRDAAGNSGNGVVTTVESHFTDVIVPTKPNNLHLLFVNDGRVSVGWEAAYDAEGVAGYSVSVDGGTYSLLGSTLGHTTDVLSAGLHNIVVLARDFAGNQSPAASMQVTVETGTPSSPPFALTRMDLDAGLAVRADRNEMLVSMGRTSCEQTDVAAAALVLARLGTISSTSTRASVTSFTGCGTISSRHFGAGERLGAVNSYRSAFGRLPVSQTDWFDVMKIANGRYPGSISASAETAAKVSFKKVYLRDANMAVAADVNAVTVMAYGLRPLPRNLNSEAAAAASFRAIYGYGATSATDWDIVRAVAYSGATR